VVLVDGRIVESGRPADLLRNGGAFAALFGDEVAA
jgi:ABC-type multidrug transport system fused ATPase/permease subunit